MINKVRDQIKKLVSDKLMFTAYDVTVAIRNGGERIKHSDVRPHVHSLFQDEEDIFGFGYEKTMTDVAGTQAFVFHPVGEDPEDHNPLPKNYTGGTPNPKVQTAPSPTPRVHGQRNRQPKNDEIKGAIPASDGRLNIPSVLLRKIDDGSGWSVVFVSNGIAITTISKANSKGVIVRTDLKNRSTHNIRLQRLTLRSVCASSYNIRLDGDMVIVEKA